MLTLAPSGGLVDREQIPDVLGHLDDGLLLGRIDANEHRRMAVDLGDHVLVDELVANRGDVAKRHDRAVELGDERNVLEILPDAPLGDGVKDHAAGVRPKLAHGEVEGPPRLTVLDTSPMERL